MGLQRIAIKDIEKVCIRGLHTKCWTVELRPSTGFWEAVKCFRRISVVKTPISYKARNFVVIAFLVAELL